jgi:Mrp family chromosome partitioning ATPase
MPVSQAVVDALGLPISAGELENLVSTKSIGRTRLVEIAVIYNDAQQAADIANEIAQQVGLLPHFSHTASVLTVAEAGIPTRPSFGPYSSILIAGITGFLVAAGVIFLSEHLRGRIQTQQDVERAFRLPVLGTITNHLGGRLEPASPRKQGEHLVAAEKTTTTSVVSPPSFSDACRWICLRLSHLDHATPKRLLVSSPHDLEGQSSLAKGLAVAWAENGRKVFLVSAHRNGPAVCHEFGISDARGAKPTTRLVEHQCADLEEVPHLLRKVRATPRSTSETASINLSTSVGKHQPPVPVDDGLLESLSERASLVIVDGPPVLSTPEAAALASSVDGVLLVLGMGKTEFKNVEETLHVVDEMGGKTLGAVLFV